jgi:hypothetical protein
MLGGLAALFALIVGSAHALNAAEPPRHGGSSLLVAKRESGLQGMPDATLETPAGPLRILNPELVAATFGQAISFELAIARGVSQGSVDITIPERWRTRTVSGLVPSRIPRATRGATGVRLEATRGAATLELDGTSAGVQTTFEIIDTGIPAGTYRLPVRWTDGQGTRSLGDLEVRLYAPAREGITPDVDSGSDERVPFNVTNDASTESETFVTVVPNNPQRVLVGANGGGGYNAWFSTNGGANFTKLAVPASMDVPDSATPELGDLCCDPYSMADDQGNLWYGGLTLDGGAGPSRIHISRIAAGTTTFVNTVGLPERTGGGIQDKPMGAIDMDPTSPRYGRLYVVWDEPSIGVNVVLSTCDTRPGGVLNAANCDNADNWSPPVSVTKTGGSYIYPEVAAGPDGKVYVIWWDYSATNAIRGATCVIATPANNCTALANWSVASTIATLDASGGAPVPFACPILAQPGGRSGPATAMDVDRSSAPSRGTVYVTWSDLRANSGTTRCDDGLAPAATHRTWDSFVATASGALPSGGASAAVGAKIITDGEGGGQANSDDWFPSVAVDQSTGRSYVNVYSTRDDVTRKTMHVYARQLNSAEQVGPLLKVSTTASDYSGNPCCGFGNDYGDYNGIDAAGGIAFVVWSDKSTADGEAFLDKVQPASTAEPTIAFGAWTFTEAAPADGDGVLEAGEDVTVSAPLGNSGSATATSTQGVLTTTSSYAVVLEGTKSYGDIAAGGTASPASPYRIRLLSTLPCGQQQVPLHLQVSYTVGTASRVDVLTANTTCPPHPAPLPPNAGPSAAITGPNTASAGRVSFDAGGSTDSDGTIARFQWDADGNAGNGFEVDSGTTPRLVATLAAGSRTVSVRVTDNGGASAQASKALRVVPAAFVRLVRNGASIRVRSGRFRLVVAGCAGCRGRLTVRAAARGRAAGRQLLGTTRFTIGRNGRANVPVRLSSNGRRRLRRLNRIRSIVSLAVTNAAGQTRAARGRITLRR